MSLLIRCGKTLFLTLACLTFVAACGGSNDNDDAVAPPPPAAELTTVRVTPANATVPAGAPQQYVATASYADGTSRDVTALSTWTSATPAAASIGANTGLAIGAAAGTAAIAAAFGGKDGSATLTVTAALLQSVTIAPANRAIAAGLTQQFSVAGTYGDGSTRDLTAVSSFSSSATDVATIGSAGLATSRSAGNSVITASAGGQSTSTNLTVTAATLVSIGITPSAATVVIGRVQQLTATGTYSDASTAPLTTTVTWSSSDTAVATILSDGIATGQSAGTATLTATLDGRSGSTGLTVTAPSVSSLDLGTATAFAVLSPSSITNNAGGTTLVTGDVGAPSQTVTPVQAAGYVNYTSGAILQSALDDLQLAITDANSRPCDVTFAGPVDLGGGTLTPGVYCYGGGINITGTLTLSGPGLYLFRTPATLNTTANAQVQTINGSAANNVFFVPAGTTTLGPNGALQGSVLSQSANIVAQDNTTLQGRLLSGGAVVLQNNVISLP